MVHGRAIRIAVVEDSAAELDALVTYVEEYCAQRSVNANITAFSTAEALLKTFAADPFDLLLLDVFLPGISGLEVARQIRTTDRDALIIFITISPDFQADGFDVWACGYILKPATPEKLAQAMHACRFLFERAGRVVKFPGPGGTDIQVVAAELVYAEVYYKRTMLHTTRGEITTRLPLAQLEKRLGGAPFLRCNRSFLVNMNHIDDVLADDLLMHGGARVPIRQRNRREIKLALARFIAGTPTEVS